MLPSHDPEHFSHTFPSCQQSQYGLHTSCHVVDCEPGQLWSLPPVISLRPSRFVSKVRHPWFEYPDSFLLARFLSYQFKSSIFLDHQSRLMLNPNWDIYGRTRRPEVGSDTCRNGLVTKGTRCHVGCLVEEGKEHHWYVTSNVVRSQVVSRLGVSAALKAPFCCLVMAYPS